MYKYVATYVNDLCIIAKDPLLLLEQLQDGPYNFKLKGSGPVNFHLGCGFECNSDGILCMNPARNINKIVQGYKQMFGEKPNKKLQLPLEKVEHPELDTSKILGEDGIKKYQS